VTRLSAVRLGGHDWIWEPCRRYLIERAILTDPHEYVMTSVVDGDDAWQRDFTSVVSATMAEAIPHLERSERTRGPHLQHSAGLAVTCPRGIEWFVHAGTARPLVFPFHSASVSIAARFSSGLSAWSCRHALWPAQCQVLGFTIREIEPDRPMWLYLRHHRTDVGWDAAAAANADPVEARDLSAAFGIDVERLQAWRSRAGAGHTRPARDHRGQPVGPHYDRMFRLAALHGQIEALQQRLAGDPAAAQDPALRALIAGQRSRRDRLLAEFRRAAFDEFA
jgi:hypothetical protein